MRRKLDYLSMSSHKAFSFEVVSRCTTTGARAGIIHTPHGNIETPIFMPVGTYGSVRMLDVDDLNGAGSQIILGNTYHLFLRPGEELVKQFGGIASFMGWNKPMLTDSGGFQVFSLAKQRKITEEGVKFVSGLDGDRHLLTPERSIGIQHALGADIIMAFDECAPSGYSWMAAKRSMERTHRWLDRSVAEHRRLEAEEGVSRKQALFAIIQGGIYPDLKRISAEVCRDSDTDGIAIGGDLKIESDPRLSYDLIADMMSYFPQNKPRYFMGVGRPDNLVESLALGVDMWDCVLPTRLGRHGVAFTRTGNLRLTNLIHRESELPIDPSCDCWACKHHTRGYIRHLLQAGEALGGKLISLHNIHFLIHLMKNARKAIIAGTFPEFLADFRAHYQLPEPRKIQLGTEVLAKLGNLGIGTWRTDEG